MTGLRLAEFDALLEDVLPRFGTAETQRLSGAARCRALGGGHPFELAPGDQVLLTVVWLRRYPHHEVLGSLVGASDSTGDKVLVGGMMITDAGRANRWTRRHGDAGTREWGALLGGRRCVIVGAVAQICTAQGALSASQGRTYGFTS